MTKKNITITALSALLILGMASMALAGHGRGGCNGQGQSAKAMYSQLTPEKQAEVKAIFDKYQPKFTDLRNAMKTKHAVLEAMINDGDANEKKIGKLVTEMSTLRDQMHTQREQMRDEISKATGLELAALGQGPGGCPGFDKERGGKRGGFGKAPCWQ